MRRDAVAVGRTAGLPAETATIRSGDWTVAPIPDYLADRRVEITGPTDRKMTINALNSGAKIWLADLEDANTPAWDERDLRPDQPARRDPPDRSSSTRTASPTGCMTASSPSSSPGRAAGTCRRSI